MGLRLGHTKPEKYYSGWSAGQTEKLGIEPATAQLELGPGLSLAKVSANNMKTCVHYILMNEKPLRFLIIQLKFIPGKDSGEISKIWLSG